MTKLQTTHFTLVSFLWPFVTETGRSRSTVQIQISGSWYFSSLTLINDLADYKGQQEWSEIWSIDQLWACLLSSTDVELSERQPELYFLIPVEWAKYFVFKFHLEKKPLSDLTILKYCTLS